LINPGVTRTKRNLTGYRDIKGYYKYQDTGISRDIIYIRIQGYPRILYILGYRDIQGYYKFQDTGISRDFIYIRIQGYQGIL